MNNAMCIICNEVSMTNSVHLDKSICSHVTNIPVKTEHFHHPRKFMLFGANPSLPQLWATTDRFLCLENSFAYCRTSCKCSHIVSTLYLAFSRIIEIQPYSSNEAYLHRGRGVFFKYWQGFFKQLY